MREPSRWWPVVFVAIMSATAYAYVVLWKILGVGGASHQP